MKKILLLFSSLILVLTACSNEEKPNPETNLILPATIAYTYPNSSEDNYKSIMAYDGNKILSIDNGTSKIKFIYEGNLIIKQFRFKVDSQGIETKSRETIYSYLDGKLSSKMVTANFSESHPNGNYTSKTAYKYNEDGTISSIQYLPNSTDIDYTGIITYKNKNLIKREINIVGDSYYENQLDVYEYDSKNNPMKDILGFDLLIEEIADYGTNNILKLTRTINNKESSVVVDANYFYNENSYPTKKTSKIKILTEEYVLNEDYTY